jgi:glucose-1-phosphate cytidylyltransferase
MKTVILAGGYGTRISEESAVRPKPMVEIGGMPILWHIMKMYSAYGFNDFIICCGYKGQMIKEYFSNYYLLRSDVTFDIQKHAMEVHQNHAEPWRVTLVDTGEKTMTGGRIKRVKDFLGKETFFLTYGDGVCNVNINELLAFHKQQGVFATLTAVQPPGRFGTFELHSENSRIPHFREKASGDGAWVNGGYFVLEPSVIEYITDDSMVWEREPMERLASDGMLSAFRHSGFWQPMDTLRDKMYLESLWESGSPPWKVWE